MPQLTGRKGGQGLIMPRCPRARGPHGAAGAAAPSGGGWRGWKQPGSQGALGRRRRPTAAKDSDGVTERWPCAPQANALEGEGRARTCLCLGSGYKQRALESNTSSSAWLYAALTDGSASLPFTGPAGADGRPQPGPAGTSAPAHSGPGGGTSQAAGSTWRSNRQGPARGQGRPEAGSALRSANFLKGQAMLS